MICLRRGDSQVLFTKFLNLRGHVGTRVNSILGEFAIRRISKDNLDGFGGLEHLRKSNFETLLDRLQNLLVAIGAHERDSQALGTEATSTTNAVQV